MSIDWDWFGTWWDLSYLYSAYLLFITGLCWLVLLDRSRISGYIYHGAEPANQSNQVDHVDQDVNENKGSDEEFEVFIIIILSLLGLLSHLLISRILNGNSTSTRLKNIHGYVTDISRVCEMDGHLVFCHASQRSRPSSLLFILLFIYQIERIVIVLSLAGMVFAKSTGSHSTSCLDLLSRTVCLSLVVLQVLCSITGAFWFFWQRNLQFNRLMTRYSSYLGQVDVARGRSIPTPPNHKRVHPLLPPKNPYAASRDNALLFDLLATLHGPGSGLRVLSVLEPDISESWEVTGLTLEFERGSLIVFWKDPVVLGYMPPASLCMSYGVELDIPGISTYTAVLTQEEIIYMKQTWSRENPEKLHLNSPQDLVYHHEFSEQTLEILVGFNARVRVWTVVHGQLISASTSTVTNLLMAKPEPEDTTQPQPVPDTLNLGAEIDESNEEPKERGLDGSSPGSLGQDQVRVETVTTRIYSKKSSSESNLLVERGQGRFNRKSGTRQSMPQGHTNYGLLVSDEDESNLEI
ncbi:uncharacterized protein LOC111701215 [Eurytemora carolleeae]|uniref:uncharacterized protein LOC111701215 n=1 Tax=Eurytemora carolleeae TaxID=1294199 RepID=UPI000C77E286|nr:uncharacterized protein LOC111701215 [Eurytemora carolleeae]|eukprot:XP_023328164.1 uncharacterized protein LOC111701215 [Eurytemora affinis]